MQLAKFFAKILFLPGTLVLTAMGISIEEDSGVFRSFINSCFWGAVCLPIAMKLYG